MKTYSLSVYGNLPFSIRSVVGISGNENARYNYLTSVHGIRPNKVYYAYNHENENLYIFTEQQLTRLYIVELHIPRSSLFNNRMKKITDTLREFDDVIEDKIELINIALF